MKVIHIPNKFSLSVFMLLVLILSACTQAEGSQEQVKIDTETSELSYTFENPNTGQEFDIIHAHSLYENYFEAVEKSSDGSIHKLYQQEVLQPVKDVCFRDAEFMNVDSFAVFEMTPKESDFDTISKQIEQINIDQLNQVIEESLVASSDILSSDDKTTVCIFPENAKALSNMMTIGAGKIMIYYDGYDKYFKTGMSHEYHHSVWLEKHEAQKHDRTGLDHLTLEGQAVMFETLVYPNLNSAFFVVDESFNKDHWSKIEPLLDVPNTEQIVEMIIGGTHDLPYSYGYSEGYKIMKSYLALHPDMTVEEWTSKSSAEIFEETNYKANYQ